MYFPTVVACAALPFLVGAVPVSLNSARAGGPISMPLKHHPSHLNDDEHVDPQKMQTSIRRTSARFDQALRAYEQNTGKPHPLAKRGSRPSNERRLFVAVNLNDTANLEWTADVTIGTPARAFSMSIDTFTPNMFVSGANCTNCQGHNLYDIDNSSTAFNENITSNVEFGGGNATGNIILEAVSIGGFEVSNQEIVVANEIDPFFQFVNFPADGSLGMGFSDTSPFNESSLFTNLVTNGAFVNGQPVIGLNLDQSSPELVIAGTDPKFSNALTFVNQSTPGFWQFPVDGLSVGGNGVFTTSEQGVIDSASHYIAADPVTISKIYANIPGSNPVPNSSGQFTIPCETNVTVTMTIGGAPFDISPNTYNLGFVAGSDTDCMGAFVTTENQAMILGTSFMRNVYTQFDLQTFQIGFAPVSVTDS